MVYFFLCVYSNTFQAFAACWARYFSVSSCCSASSPFLSLAIIPRNMSVFCDSFDSFESVRFLYFFFFFFSFLSKLFAFYDILVRFPFRIEFGAIVGPVSLDLLYTNAIRDADFLELLVYILAQSQACQLS